MKIEMRQLSEIIPYHKNPRKISQRAIDLVAASLLEYGWQQPLVVDTKGVLVCGHTRRLAALKLGWTEAPVHVADKLTPAQIRAYRLMDNRSNSESTWDEPTLTFELGELKALDFDLSLTGFSEHELFNLMPSADSDAADEVGPVPVNPVTRPGDLWLLGSPEICPHCGEDN
jgi:ParB-like chromosome segregation protein Spo0J